MKAGPMRRIATAVSLVFIFLIPWEGVVDFPGLGAGESSTLAKYTGLALAAVWAVMVMLTGRFRKPTAFHFVVYLFVAWNAVSIFWSLGPERTITHVMTWAQLLILVFILWDLFTTRTTLLAGLQAYILGAYISVGSAVYNFLAGNSYYTNYQRFSAGDTNPDGFGFILAVGVPLAWYLALSPSMTKLTHRLKLINYVYIPAAFLGIALSGTRTALIATIPGMAFGLASLTRLRLWARVAIMLLFTATALFVLPYLATLTSFQRFGTIGTELAEGDLNNRTVNWQEGLAVFADHPIIGIGSNMYRSVNSLGKVAHNSFISILVELGLIGFTLFGAILVMVARQALRHPRWEARFWLTVLAVWAIGASTLTWEYRKQTWVLLSMIVASAALPRQQEEIDARVEAHAASRHLVRQAN
jgi:O-antigen ligase